MRTAGDNLFDENAKKAEDFDTAMFILKSKKGVLIHINNSRRAVYGYDQRVEVFGSKGTLVLEDNQLSGCSLDKQEFEPIYPPINSNDLASNQLELLNYLWTKMVEDFIRSIRQTKTSVPTFYDGLKGQQVIDAVRLSGQENKWIQLT